MEGKALFQGQSAAYDYAFVLAWSAFLDELRKPLDALSDDPSVPLQKSCDAEELSIGLRVVRNYGLRTLSDQFAARDLEENSTQGYFRSSLTHRILSSLLPTHVLPQVHPTESILNNLDESGEGLTALAQNETLRANLLMVLQNAVRIATGSHELADQPMSEALSGLFVAYISDHASDLSSVNAFEGMSSHTLSYLKNIGARPCAWQRVFEHFRALLVFHMDLTWPHATETSRHTGTDVMALRETGNNLMANTCYPQALMVYTQAIDACTHEDANNLSQLYTNRAIAFVGLNCFLEAVTDLTHALVNDRTFVPAWAQLGYCHLYLGSSLLALRCYLAALRSLAGEVYPEGFPENEAMRHEYTEAKLNTTMPQFIQKLVSCIILTVKRAEQQRESANSIQEITTRVRAILARLRSYVAAEDLPYLSYSYETDFDSIRSSAARASRVRPSILTPDVAQDIMASTHVEASAVTVGGPTITRAETTAMPVDPSNDDERDTNNDDGPHGDTTAPNPSANQPPDNQIRGLLNTLGNIVGDALQARSGNQSPAANTLPTAAEAPPIVTTFTPTSFNDDTNNGQPTDYIGRALFQTQRALNTAQQNSNTPTGGTVSLGGFDLGESFSGLISQALRNHEIAAQRARPNSETNGNPAQTSRPSTGGNASSPTTNTSAPQLNIPSPGNAPRNESTSFQNREDGEGASGGTEVPDVPDLD